MRPSTGTILPSFLFDKTLDSAASIERYSINPSEQVCLNRSTERKGMQNVLVDERWGKERPVRKNPELGYPVRETIRRVR
jgi:hypothetical protein